MPLPIFRRCVAKYQGDHRVRKFSCLDHFFCMTFAQITYRESLRDIEVCLRSQQKKLYHMGALQRRIVHRRFGRNRLCPGLNHYRSLPLSFSMGNFSPKKSCGQTTYPIGPKGKHPNVYPYFRWQTARCQRTRSFISGSGSILRHGSRLPGFERLNEFNQVLAYFVTRAKSNTKYKRRYSHPVDKSTGLICDQTILLTGFYTKKDYPGVLRRVKFRDEKSSRT